MNYINTKTACNRLGVHPNTLRNWDKEGKIKTIRTPGGNSCGRNAVRLIDLVRFKGKNMRKKPTGFIAI